MVYFPQSQRMCGLSCAVIGAFVLAGSGVPHAGAAGLKCSIDPSFGTPGVDCQVLCFEVFDDGNGPALFVGGDFANIGGLQTGEVAKWDGRSWSALGLGTNASVWSMKAFGPKLYMRGNFSMAGGAPAPNLATWDGQNWQPLFWGNLVAIQTMEVFDDGNGPALYVGGNFTTISGVSASRIAKWDGQTFTPLGLGTDGGVTKLLAASDSNGPALFVLGGFNNAGGNPASKLARWDGKNWSSLNWPNFQPPSSVVAGPNNTVYVSTIGQIKQWSGTGWTNLPSVDTVGSSMVVDSSGNIYTSSSSGLLKWNGISWKSIGIADPQSCTPSPGLGPKIIFDDDGHGPSLFVGGAFKTIGGHSASSMAKLRLPLKFYDVVCDGTLNIDDLVAVITRWGPCPPQDACLADLTDDNQVNIDDLVRVVTNWGP